MTAPATPPDSGASPDPGASPEAGVPVDTTTAGRVDPTGHPLVDAALDAVARAGQAPPADQVPVFQAAHRTLRDTLANIDQS